MLKQKDSGYDVILNVSARDLGTKKETKVRIEQSSGLSKEEIERMQRDAELHAVIACCSIPAFVSILLLQAKR